ncbi:hypothetical protein E2562_026762 [Oryza meyeriana var. granulata]|uniref:BAT2 N-terminal domain-containing protein n=1 Tax=Oryza meyeriana var. granulata TaxID=110450 RepID=A0A6G1C9G1_9ORYZ|nr:hypothetical protein E2562_026762 [Oryza meyeriana var. granulata]
MVTAVLAADKRLGASPAKSPGARVLGVIPKPINLQSQRLEIHGLKHDAEIAPKGMATQGNKPMPPASNAWGAPSLMYPKNDGGLDSFSHISDRPSSGGSSTTSSIGSDFLDIPSVWGPNSNPLSVSRVNHLPTAANRLRSTEARARTLRPSHFPDSSTQVVKASLRTNNRKWGLKMLEKGFTLSMDDFPVLGSVNSESNTRRGHNLQGRPTFSTGSQMAQDEQRKSLLTGVGEVISSSNYEHGHVLRADYVYEGDAQVPAAILPWGAKHAQKHGTNAPKKSVPPPWFNYWHPPPDHPPDENEMLHEGATPYGSDKPADPHIICAAEPRAYYGQFLLNQEAAPMQRPGYGGYMSDNQDGYHPDMQADAAVIIQPHILGKVKHGHSEGLQKQPFIKKDVILLQKIKCLNIKARNLHACKISELLSSKESMIEHSKSIHAEADHVKKDVPFSAVTSDTMSTFDRASSFSESSDFVPSSPGNVPGNGATLSEVEANISGNGWEEHSTVDSLQVVITNAQQDKSFPRNVSQQVHVAADEMLNLLDNEIQLHSRTRELSTQHAKQVLEEQDWNSQQKAKSIAELEELIGHSPEQNQKTNDAPLEADNLHFRQRDGGHGTTEHDISTQDTYCIAPSESLIAPLPANKVNHITASISSAPASDTAGISKDTVIHNVISPAKNTEINMMEAAPKSTSQSHDSSAQQHWKMENRQRQVESRERITMERSNIAEKAEYVKNIAETPADAEAKHYEDLSTQDKNSRRDAAAASTASQSVLDNKKNGTNVPSVHKTLAGVVISNSMVPAHVTSVSGLTVGSIMLGDISFISANQERATAAREIHDTKNSHSMPTSVQQPSKKEHPEEGGLNNLAVAAPSLPSGHRNIAQETVMVAERSEMERYKPVHKDQLNQWNLGKILPAENHRASYGNPAKFNLGTENCDKEALDNFTSAKAEVTTELDKWLDKEPGWGEVKVGTSWSQQYTDGSASVARHLTEQVDKSDQWQSFEPDKQVKRQFEFKTHDGSENRWEPAHTAPLSVNDWEKHHASYSQRQNHVEGQRNVRSNNATNIYKERRGRTCAYYEVPSLSRAHWVPKSFSYTHSNSQQTVVSEWIQDPYQGIYNMDNSQGFDSAFVDSSCNELIQNIDRDSEMDLYRREWEYQLPSPPHHEMDLYSEQIEGDVIWEDGRSLVWNPRDWEYQPLNTAPHHHDQHSRGQMYLYSEQIEGDVMWADGHPLIWNPRDWEYQPLNPAPHPHDQHSWRDRRGGDTNSERGYDAWEQTYGVNEGRRKGGIRSEFQSKLVGSSDVAPGIHWNPGAYDQNRWHPTSRVASRERRYYI